MYLMSAPLDTLYQELLLSPGCQDGQTVLLLPQVTWAELQAGLEQFYLQGDTATLATLLDTAPVEGGEQEAIETDSIGELEVNNSAWWGGGSQANSDSGHWDFSGNAVPHKTNNVEHNCGPALFV